MPDPPLARPPPLPDMVLVDRYVRFVDDLMDIIEERGDLPLDLSIESVLNDLPRCSSRKGWTEWEDEQQRAIREEIIRYRSNVQEPAFAILCERKASRPGAMRKESVNFSCDDADYYRKVLDGIDLRLPQPTAGNIINHLTIGLSWHPMHHLWSYPPAGYITSSHDDFIVLYFGTYRPGLSEPGCYLVVNTCANSVAIVPPLPARCVTATSHCGIGTGVAVLRHNNYGDYVLAELCLRRENHFPRPSNKATLFLWWSPDSGPLAGRWMQKEVVLPLPTNKDMVTFRADMVFAVSNTALCWVDLHTGVLICNDVNCHATGSAADEDMVFSFIPLPKECTMKIDGLCKSRPAEEYRTMSCLNHENILFVCMDSYTQGCPVDKTMLAAWILDSPLMAHWSWRKVDDLSLCVGDLLGDLPKKSGKLLIPSRPVISMGRGEPFIDLILTAFDKPRNVQRGVTGVSKIRIDMHGGVKMILELSSPVSPAFQYAEPFAVGINFGLDRIMMWERLQKRRPRLKEKVVDEKEKVVDEDWVWCFPEGIDDANELANLSILNTLYR